MEKLELPDVLLMDFTVTWVDDHDPLRQKVLRYDILNLARVFFFVRYPARELMEIRFSIF